MKSDVVSLGVLEDRHESVGAYVRLFFYYFSTCCTYPLQWARKIVATVEINQSSTSDRLSPGTFDKRSRRHSLRKREHRELFVAHDFIHYLKFGMLRLTDAVHSQGGRIFLQLIHCGRISHPSMQPDNSLPIAPSALRPDGQAVTYGGMRDFVTPRALAEDEIMRIAGQFLQSAELAKRAGFDGLEIHGANGYLVDQFLRDGTNHRTDAYGGSPQNRMRLLNEILDAVLTVWSPQRIGVRFSPENSFNSMSDSDPQKHFGYFAQQLNSRGLAYLHVLEGDMIGEIRRRVDYHSLRSKFSGTYISNNGHGLESAKKALQNGTADLIAFGTPFIANPDLVRRYRENLPLNQADRSAYYGGTETGYTDYPFYGE